MNFSATSLIKYKFLLKQLVTRDIKVKYQRSVLGILWSVLNPLLSMLVITIVFSHFFRFQIKNFPIYLLSGQTIFMFYSEATNLAMFSIKDNSSLIKKVFVPVYIFPLSRVCSACVNFLFSLIAIFLVMLLTGFVPKLSILLILIPAFYIFIFSIGVGLVLSSLSVFFKDIIHLYGVFLTLINYLTPIFYPISIVPHKYMFLIKINPFYYFVDCFRTVVYNGTAPSQLLNLQCICFALFMLCVGILIFSRSRKKFIYYL